MPTNGQHLRKAGVVAAVALTMTAAAASAQADFTGVWQVRGNPNRLLEDGGKAPPLTRWGAALYAKNKARLAKKDYSNDLVRDRCASPGAVRMMTLQHPIEIFQRPHQLTMLFEWNHLYRLIHLDPKRHEAPYSMAIGMSNARWEGPVLVVETTDLIDNTQLDNTGLPHGDQTKLTERIRLVSPGVLEDKITIHDAKAFTRDWTVTLTYDRTAKTAIEEDTCLDRLDAGQPALTESP